MRYVWIIYEISTHDKEYLFGIFSTEELAMNTANEEFSAEGTPDYRIERYKLDPL